MDILLRMKETTARFEELKTEIAARENKINEIKEDALNKINRLEDEISHILTEMAKCQGEYRLLIELGQEQGLIDEDGNIVEQEVEE